MALNARGSFTLDLALFGSLVQDIQATDLPPGGSPDNSDCFYLPGGVFTRPAVKRILPVDTLANSPTIMSLKELPGASGDNLTVFLDSNGLLYSNDPLNPDVVTELDAVTPGVQFKAENYAGKQWYAFYSYLQAAAFSVNPFVGVDVPRYFDGDKLWRVTSDAPGISPTFSNLFTTALPLYAPPIAGTIEIVSVLSTGEQSSGTPVPSPGPSVLQSGVASSNYPATSTTFSFPLAVGAGDGILVCIALEQSSLVSVSDNIGSTYQLISSVGGVSGTGIDLFVYLATSVAGGRVTVNVQTAVAGGPGGQACTIACHDMTGLASGLPIDQSGTAAFGAQTIGEPTGTFNTGTISTANANDWIFTFAFSQAGPPTSHPSLGPPDSFTSITNGSSTDPIGALYLISTALEQVSATGTFTPTWSTRRILVAGGITIGLMLTPATPPTPPTNYWTQLTYTCMTEVPVDWIGSIITVTGFVGAGSDVANISGNISEIDGDKFIIDFTTSEFVSISLASMFATGTVSSGGGNYMVRHNNFVTAYIGPTLPDSAFLDPGFWISVLNADNSLLNGDSWEVASFSRDSNGLVTITIGTQLTNLPVGASLYVDMSAEIITGTATATVGDPTLIITGGPPADQSWVGQPLTFSGNNYIVASVQSTGVITLTVGVISGTSGTFDLTINFFTAGYITVKQVISATSGTTTFTFDTLNTTPISTNANGGVYQTWSPQFGTYGNAAQITNVGFDPIAGWFFQFFQLGPDYALVGGLPNAPLARVQAQAAAGPRSAVVMFKSLDGAITAPSVPVSLAVSGGTSLIQASNIPIGPPGTAQRIIAFTPANGANFYYISPVTVPQVGASAPVTATGTIIDDNVTTSQVLDFSDTQLVSATQIDIAGNNLFNQVVLAPCLGVIEYQGRLGWWGEINNVKNFVNMGFDGGFIAPAGALAVTNGSSTATWVSGQKFSAGWVGAEIIIAGAIFTVSGVVDANTLTLNATYTGTSNTYPFTVISTSTALPPGWDASQGDGKGSLTGYPSESPYFGFSYVLQGGFNCLIQQGCVTDAYGAQILKPSTQYTIRFQAGYTGSAPGGAVIVDIFSPSQGVLASSSFPVVNMASTGKTWQAAELSNVMPASIPSDAVLRLYGSNIPVGASGFTVTVDELEVIYTNQPVSFDQMRLSYFQNPFGYDSITGILSVDPAESLTATFEQRGYLYILSDIGLFQSQNNGQEPVDWPVIRYASACGCSGPNAIETTEDIAYWAGRYGGRGFNGDPSCKKITQELAPTWESINWNAQTTMWVKNDPVNRAIYFGIPTGSAATPNVMLQMSYRLADAAFNVPDPIHVSQFSGRMICTDLGRRWSPWQLPINCADMCTRQLPNGLARTLVVGGGNGLAPGTAGFGNLYTFDTTNYPPTSPQSETWNCTDDDYGKINSYYVTYFFFSPDVEQNPLLSLHRKLFNYLAVHATGVGSLKITPLIDSLVQPANSIKGGLLPLPAVPLSLTDPNFDIEWHPIIRGNRVAWKVQPVATEGIAQAMAVTHFIVSGRREMIFPLRGTVFGY